MHGIARISTLLLIVTAGAAQQYTEGTLRRVDRQGQAVADCPLKHTSVKAEISGMLARVTVTQEFQNPFSEPIEAVYGFPLPHDASVDQMTMTVGDRTIKGKIKPREEARAMYEAARNAGKTASLLDQERPNIFTQSVANVLPGSNVRILISYVEVLKYESGDYEFVFPMVVGPRYIPGSPTGKQGRGWSPDTDRTVDASRITPPVAPPDTRVGHDISIEVSLDAGVPLGQVQSNSHDIDVLRAGANRAVIRLRDQAAIPNKDFVLRYDSAGRTIQTAVLTHRTSKGGFFLMIVQPPERSLAADLTPKELIFVLDTSGSMSGFPIEKAKETMKLALEALHPRDTFNLITFSGDTEILFSQPVPATPENLRIAQLFLQSRRGAGGTEMMKAIRAALDPSGEAGRVRIVCFMTDGYVGNDMEIIAEVRKHPEARVFAFGIGRSVNRFLLDRMSIEGRGEVEYAGLGDDAAASVRRFEQRVRDPLLTDITIDWAGLPVTDVYPSRIPDLFSAQPIVVTGRFNGPARGRVRLRGTSGGNEVVRSVAIDLPASEAAHDVLATIWARRRVTDLMTRDYAGLQAGQVREDVKKEITQAGLDYAIMTQFTSFVAVEERIVTTGGQSRTVDVPVAMPEGVRYEAVFGPGTGFARAPGYGPASGSGSGGGVYRIGGNAGVAGGTPGGVIGGIIGASPQAAPPPPPPKYAVAAVAAREAPAASNAVAKLDPALQSLLQAPGATRTIGVQVLLRDSLPDTIDELAKAGLVVTHPPGRDLQVRGRIAVEKLLSLAQIEAVRYVVRSER